MKRKVALLLAFCMIFTVALVGCSSASTDNTATSAPASSAPATSAPAASESAAASSAPASSEPATSSGTGLPTTFKQSPMLDSVSGLAPIADRLPKEPKLTNEMPADLLTYEIGTYGGTLRTVTSVVEWDADVFVMNNEALLNTPGILGKEVTGNILKGYEVSADAKEFTFYLREGLKWSDGQPVTMEDFQFTWNDIISNPVYTPVFPDWLCSGGTTAGKPGVFTKVDDWTFKLTFDQPYAGILIRMAIQGWRGYTDFLKPSHYLKQYTKGYGDETAMKAKATELKIQIDTGDKPLWYGKLFSMMDVSNWQLCQHKAKGFPVLYPWVVSAFTDQDTTFTRNPYYFKVDSAGNQLPYIDTIKSTLVQNMEMVTMKTLAGEVDFSRESASLVNMPSYKESESKGITALLCKMHVTPSDIFINQTYADDNFKKVVQNVNFRKAMNMALDRKQIIDKIYYGYADPGHIVDSTFDLAAAGKLLDDMGMTKGADGFRIGPDGKKFSLLLEVQAAAPDIVPLSELVVEMWKALGIDASTKRIDGTLWGTKNAGNQLQATIIWTHTPLWYMGDWGMGNWCPTWNTWFASSGKSGEEPPQAVKDMHDLIIKLSVVKPDEAPAIYDQIVASMQANVWYMVHIDNVKQPLVINSKLGNVSDKGFAIAANFSGEQFFFKK